MTYTKKEHQLIQRFNQRKTHVIISRWPSKQGQFDGIATYTVDTVTSFAKFDPKAKFVVFAESVEELQVFLLTPGVRKVHPWGVR